MKFRPSVQGLLYHLSYCQQNLSGRDSSVGIATRYELDGPGIESRWWARFPAPVQAGPGSHPASCTMGTRSFQGVKRPGRGANPHPHLQCGGLKLGRAIPVLTLRALVAYTGGTFTFFSTKPTLSSFHFSTFFPTNNLYAFLSPRPLHTTCPVHSILLDLITNNVVSEKIRAAHHVFFSSIVFFPLSPTHLPQQLAINK